MADSQWEVIEKVLNDHGKREHSLGIMMNAILWITRGSQCVSRREGIWKASILLGKVFIITAPAAGFRKWKTIKF